MPQRLIFAASVAAIALAACQQEAAAPADPNADANAVEATPNSGPVSEAPAVPLVDGQGNIIGSVRGGDSDGGAVFQVEARGLPPGVHGMHLHTVGRCEGPAFESAGAHWNPSNKQHGLENPQGAHAGDLANITVGADGTYSGTVTIAGSYLNDAGTQGAAAQRILDADGSALVIHAQPDDNRTDPSGNSGDRIACASFSS